MDYSHLWKNTMSRYSYQLMFYLADHYKGSGPHLVNLSHVAGWLHYNKSTVSRAFRDLILMEVVERLERTQEGTVFVYTDKWPF